MIGEVTTVGLSPTGIDGDNFDVFSSLRDGADGEKFASGIGEVVADGAGQLDLVAVAGGEAELIVAISDNDTKEDCTPIDPEFCRNFGSAACFGCVNLGLCQDRQAAMMANKDNPQSEEQLSTLEQLLREDEASGEIVWAQVAPETDEAGDLSQIEEVSEVASPGVVEVVLDCEDISEEYSYPKEQKSNIHDEEDGKIADVDVETVKNMEIDNRMVESQATDPGLDEPAEMSEQLTPEDTVVLPTSMAVEAEPVAPAVKDVNKVSDDFADMVVSDIQASPQIEVKEPKSDAVVKPADSLPLTLPVEVPSGETSPDNTTVDHAGDYDNSYHMVSEPEEKIAPPVTEQGPSVQMSDTPVNVPMENAKHETLTKEVVAVEVSVKEQPDQPAVMTSPIQDYAEYGDEVSSVGEEPAVDHNSIQPVVDMPVVHEAVEVVLTENVAIEPEAPTPVIPVETIVDEDELWTDPPQDGNREAAVDQTVYEVQISPVEQFDDVVMEENSRGNGEEVWAEEDVVFFVEQSSVVEPEAPLTEAVTTEPLTEVTIVASEEIDEPEVFVADEIEIEPVDLLNNLQATPVPEITKDDHEPVERSMVPVSSAIEPASNATLDEAPVQMSEEYGLPREKQDNVITTTPEGNDVWLGSDEPETMAMDGSDAEQSGDLSEEQEDPVVIDRVAEVTETELSEQDDLVTDDVADGYGYDSEVNAADDLLIVKHHPSLGLWTDDSRLNPEDSKTPTTGSASVVAWLTKLVGVVAVHVVYNAHENKLNIQ